MIKKRILILGRVNDRNLGDAIIVDTCAYALRNIAKQNYKKISLTALNIYSKDTDNIRRVVKDYDAIVFPGGGLNSIRFVNTAKAILKGNTTTKLFFNANGISTSNIPKIKKGLMDIMNNELTVQVTTRGDFETAKEYVTTDKKYPVAHILDPAIFSKDTYGVSKDDKSDVVGVGLIRSEIFAENGRDFEKDAVFAMYVQLLDELDKRGIKWELFCNGTKADYNFAKFVLEETGRPVTLLAPRPKESIDLIKLVAKYKGIIAARFHANIIATSLEVPSVALVWNDKMLGFADLIGCRDRYVNDLDKLRDAKALVDILEKAMAEGYDKDRIDREKKRTLKVMSHIIGRCYRFKV